MAEKNPIAQLFEQKTTVTKEKNTDGIGRLFVQKSAQDITNNFEPAKASAKKIFETGWNDATTMQSAVDMWNKLATRAETVGKIDPMFAETAKKYRETANTLTKLQNVYKNYASTEAYNQAIAENEKAVAESKKAIDDIVNFDANKVRHTIDQLEKVYNDALPLDNPSGYEGWTPQKYWIYNKSYGIVPGVTFKDAESLKAYIDKLKNSITQNKKDKELLGYAELIDKTNVVETKDFADKLQNNEYMTEEQRETYNKLYKIDKEKADKYWNLIQETVNYAKALKTYENISDKEFLQYLYSVPAGLERFGTGVVNVFKPNDSYYAPSAMSMTSSMIKKDKQGTFGGVVYDLTENIAYMAPTIAVSYLSKGLGAKLLASKGASSTVKALGQALVDNAGNIGRTVMGASVYGNSYAEMINSGYNVTQAKAYGTLTAISEVLLTDLLSGVAGIGGSKLTSNAIKNADSALMQFAIRHGGEAVEEGLQTVLESVFKSAITGEIHEADIGEVLYSALLGFASSASLSGVGTGALKTVDATKNVISKIKANANSVNKTKQTNELIDYALKFPEGAVSREIATMMKSGNGAYTIAEYLHDRNWQMNERDVQNLTDELISRGFMPENATVVADAIGKVTNGVELTEDQQNALNKDTVTTSVLLDGSVQKDSRDYGTQAEYQSIIETPTEEAVVQTEQTPIEQTRQKTLQKPQEAVKTDTKLVEGKTITTQDSDTLNKLGKALNRKIRVVDSLTKGGEQVNGYINTKTGEIVLNAKAKNAGKVVLKHELTHSLERLQDYFDFFNTVTESKVFDKWLKDKGKTLQQLRQETIDFRQTIGDENFNTSKSVEELQLLAEQEILADFVGDMLYAEDGGIEQMLEDLSLTQKRNFIEWIRDIIQNLIDKVKGVDTSLENELRRLEKKFSKMLKETAKSEKDVHREEAKKKYQYKAMETDLPEYRKMLTKWGGMTESQVNKLFNTIDKSIDKIKKNLEILDYAWEQDIDDRVFNPVKANSDSLYKVSVDFSTACRKRILQQVVQAQLEQAMQRPLTRDEMVEVRSELIKVREEGRAIEVACGLCYVEAARLKSPKQIEKFLNNRENYIKEFFAAKSGGDIKQKIKQAEIDKRKELGVGNTALKELPKEQAEAIRKAKRDAKASYVPTTEEADIIKAAKKMKVTDFTTIDGLTQMAKKYPSLYDAYTSFVRNATKSKKVESDVWWRAGDSQNISDNLILQMNAENGLRSQSWSDFQVIHLLDYIGATMELATRNAKEQVYTKVVDFVHLMGLTNAMINLSLIPKNINATELDFDSIEGMDYKEALKLRDRYHKTAGTIAIGVSYDHTIKLLDSIYIDYVIPYHNSGLPKALREKMSIPGWESFQNEQSEKQLSRTEAQALAQKYGVKLLDSSDANYHTAPKFSEWFKIKQAQEIAKRENANPTNDINHKKYGVMYGGYMAMQNAAQTYIEMCVERGVSPKFSTGKGDFTSNENYWKLLIDRKMIDNVTGEVIEQQAIKPEFSETEILRILNEEIERYPKVKADQEYASRKVVSEFLKNQADANEVTDALQKSVDNITNVSIAESGKEINQSETKLSISKSEQAEILEMLKNGQITTEEAMKRLDNTKEKPLKELKNVVDLTKDRVVTRVTEKKRNQAEKKDKESRFAENLDKSKWFDKEFKGEARNDNFIQTYAGITNKETLQQAVAELDEGGQERVSKWIRTPAEQATLVDEAIGFILLERAKLNGDLDSQLTIAQKLREYATSGGRKVQLFSIMGRLTPEGMMLYAQTELDQALKVMQERRTKRWLDEHEGKFKLTEADKEYITRRVRQASMLPEGSRAKDILLAEISTRIQNKLPVKSGQSLKALQRISMLLNVKTNIRNVASNALSMGQFQLADLFGTGIDALTTKYVRSKGFDAQRTTGFGNVKENIKAFGRGAYNSYDDFRRKINTRGIEQNRYEIGEGTSFDANTKNKVWNAVAQRFNELDRLTSFLLDFGDRPFYEMWFTNSLNAQMRLNRVDTPTVEMIEIATEEALQRTWQDSNKLTKAANSAKDFLNKFNFNMVMPFAADYGLGDVFIKFTKTPANLAKAIFDFSPVGLTRSIIFDAKEFNESLKKGKYDIKKQKKFVNNLSKGVAGTIIQLAISALASAGILSLTGKNDDDDDVRAFENYVKGMPQYSIKIGDTYITYDWAQPLGAYLATIADYMQEKEANPNNSDFETLLTALSSGGNVLMQQSFLYSLQNLFSSFKGSEGVFTNVIASLFDDPSVYIPQILSQVAELTDEKRRVTYSEDGFERMINKIKVKIPGLRQTLEAERNVLGEEAENPRNDVFNAFFNPGNVYSKVDNEVVDEVYALYKATGEKKAILPKADSSVSANGVNYRYSIEEKATVQKVMGQTAVKIIDDAMNLKDYENLTDQQKVEFLTKVYSYSKAKAKSDIVYSYDFLHAIYGDVLTQDKYNNLSDKQKKMLADAHFLSAYSEVKEGEEAEYFIKKVEDSTKNKTKSNAKEQKANSKTIDTIIKNK